MIRDPNLIWQNGHSIKAAHTLKTQQATTMSTPEQQLEAAKSILSDVVEYLEERRGEAAEQLREKAENFLEEVK